MVWWADPCAGFNEALVEMITRYRKRQTDDELNGMCLVLSLHFIYADSRKIFSKPCTKAYARK